MSRILNFFDGQSSSTTPTLGGSSTTGFQVHASDAAFVTNKGTAAADGDHYLNSTVNKDRFFILGTWRQTEAELNNSTAGAPTVTDDSASGFEINSIWHDTATDFFYANADASVGAAVWIKLAKDADLLTHIADTTTHGTTGNIVGTSDAQVLTLILTRSAFIVTGSSANRSATEATTTLLA